MAYLLDGTEIARPTEFRESNSTQVAQQRTLSGAITRDHFGSNKKVWVMSFRNKKVLDYDTINTIYQSYLSTGDTKTWQITEANYTVASTNVHVDLLLRQFTVKGSDYLSDFDLILTEA